MPSAEKYGVTVIMELLNSYGHKDYQCDRTAWGSALCEMVGSNRFKLLYDIYHMQRMEGDLAATIERLLPRIGHVQIAGNPGRHEPSVGEINFRFLIERLDALGYEGVYLGGEARIDSRGRGPLSLAQAQTEDLVHGQGRGEEPAACEHSPRQNENQPENDSIERYHTRPS